MTAVHTDYKDSANYLYTEVATDCDYKSADQNRDVKNFQRCRVDAFGIEGVGSSEDK